MNLWVVFIILYAAIISLYMLTKKKAIEIDSVYHVVFYISLIALVFATIISKDIFSVQPNTLFYLSIKSIIVTLSWLCGGYALSKLPLGAYGMNKIIKIIITIIFSILILGEMLSFKIIIGIAIVILSIFIVNFGLIHQGKNKKVTIIALLALLLHCLCASTSEIMDKVLMQDLTVSQMQFWVLFFTTVFSGIVLLIKEKSIKLDLNKGNYWLIIAAFCLVIGDRFLYAANKEPDSIVSIMVVIKQLNVFFLIILGRIIYKEKSILMKMLCFLMMIIGLVIILI